MSAVIMTYKEKVKRLSERLLEAQRPIRILDAIKWPAHVLDEFRKMKFKDIPELGTDTYDIGALGYDPEEKQEELRDILLDIERSLGKGDEIGALLIKATGEYIRVIDMLRARGTREFWEHSRVLYGSPQDTLLDGKATISDLGLMLYTIFSRIENVQMGIPTPENLTAEDVVDQLNVRMKAYFGDAAVKAKLSDGIVADASAGSETIKIKSDAMFSSREVDTLEVHEGWVHIGTAVNGAQQHVAKWLARGPPRVASTQEGLAVIMEIFTFRSSPRRAKQINDRIIGIEKVEQGANVIELMEFYQCEGYTEEESLFNVMRVFRGGPLTGGAPFTKDIAYCKGFIQNYNFMRAAIRAGKPQLLPFLFVGKLDVDDVPLLYQKHLEGIIDFPKHLPPQFQDLNGLSVWMAFSNFLNTVDLKTVQEHYDKLFSQHL